MHLVRVVAAALLLVGWFGLTGSARADPPTDEQRALEQVLAALEAHPPETVREYRVAFRELGLVGDSALPHLKALLRRYVDNPGFDDLMAPWGGGADAPAHERSYPDGAPLPVFFYAGPEQLRELALRNPGAGLPRALLHAWLDASGALHVTGSDRLAQAFAARDRAYPVFGFRELVGFSGLAEAEHYAASAWGVPGLAAQELFLDQS